MELLEQAEFKNQRGDKVNISLFADSFGGFHLIAKVSMLRTSEETRVRDGKLVKLPTTTHTKETKHVQTNNAHSAMVEFKLECYMNGMPDFGATEFQSWLIAFSAKEGK